MLTEKDVTSFLQHEKKIHDRIDEVMAIIHSASPISNYDEESYSVDIDHDGSVEIRWTVYSNCSCCDDNEYSFFIDTDVLLKSDDDIKKIFIAKKAEKDAKEKQKEIDKKLKIEADKKEKKRQNLEKLLAEKERGEF